MRRAELDAARRARAIRLGMRRRVSDTPEYARGFVFHGEHETHIPGLCDRAALASLDRLNLLLPNPAPGGTVLPAPDRPASAFLALAHEAPCPEIQDALYNMYLYASNGGVEPNTPIVFSDILTATHVLSELAMDYVPPRRRRAMHAAIARVTAGRMGRI